MAGTVFILGAGASADAGAPLMKDFLSVARIKVLDARHELEIVQRGINMLSRTHSKLPIPGGNLEDAFAAFETATVLGRFPGLNPDEIKELVPAMRQVILETLDKTVDYPMDRGPHTGKGRPKAPGLYGDFVQLVSELQRTHTLRHAVSVLTFNYDMAIDHAFSIRNIETDYFLGERRGGIPLLKLHGSLNWARHKQSGKMEVLSVDRYLTDYVNELNHDLYGSKKIQIEVSKFMRQYYGSRDDFEVPVIIPPTWNKSGHYGQIAPVWRAAAKALADAENIFIIGYSIPKTDMLFRHLVAIGTATDTPLERLWVFNPTPEVESKIEPLGFGAREKFKFFPQYFSEAINELRDKFSLE